MISSDFLQDMAAGSRERIAAARRYCPESTLLERALSAPAPPRLRSSPAGFDLIAELKLRSPAVGQLRSAAEDVTRRLTMYASSGAAAVSVLTEPGRFDGSMEHLQVAARCLAPLGVPVMRKDFIVEPYQIIEARAAGAGGVLVILRLLPRSGIRELLACARTLGLFVLLEAFDARDIEGMHELISLDAQASPQTDPARPLLLAGLNCRDLTTLRIVPERLIELAHLLPVSVPRVAESGVVLPDDARRVSEAGYAFALVGTALMQGENPHTLAASMLEAGRSAQRQGKSA